MNTKNVRPKKKSKVLFCALVALFLIGGMILSIILLSVDAKAVWYDGNADILVGGNSVSSVTANERITYKYFYKAVASGGESVETYHLYMKAPDGSVSEVTHNLVNFRFLSDGAVSHDFNAPVAPGEYSFYLSENATSPARRNSQAVLTVLPPTPTPAPTVNSNYYESHYDFWLDVQRQLAALPKGGTLTVQAGIEIDHIMHFVFDSLVGTTKTLVVKRDGLTYRIKGAPEAADGTMRGIMLGHNQLFFGNLDGFVVK